MGSLRCFLALCVAYGHAGNFLGFQLVPGDTAVQVFYAISGFYMALVLNEKYHAPSFGYAFFVSNRFLRLFPIYATVLCLTLVPILAVATFTGREPHLILAWHAVGPLDWSSAAFLIASQAIMWGQDLFYFLTVKGGALTFIPNFSADPHPLYKLLIIPQSWTLSVELSFYLVAPFILRRSVRAVALLLAASLLLRLLLQVFLGYQGDPWSFRFFPSELALFLMGALGYHLYRAPVEDHVSRLVVFLLADLAVSAALLINRSEDSAGIASVCFLMFACAVIPLLFRLTKHNVFDRHLGELSYPIYISHMTAIWFTHFIFPAASAVLRGTLAVLATVMVSSVLYWAIDRPVDRWRQRRFQKHRSEQRLLIWPARALWTH